MPVPMPKRRFTVDEYYRMAEAGILRPGERVELIEGEIIQMAAIGSRHAACVSRLNRLLTEAVGRSAQVRVQLPVRLSDLSEPEPDVALVRARDDDYATGHPGPADVLLIVEVSDTTAGYDREEKGPLYALSGIPEFWLVDNNRDRIEVRRGASPEGYTDLHTAGRGDVIRIAALPDTELAVDSILP